LAPSWVHLPLYHCLQHADYLRLRSGTVELMDASQFEILERSKRRILSLLCVTLAGLVILSALRFVPRLNDIVSGKPGYVRILTDAFARQLVAQTQGQSPVIVEQDEDAPCEAVNVLSIADDDIRGTLYVLTYSERQHLTCITSYAVPTNTSAFSNLRTITPATGDNYGPAILDAVKVLPLDRIAHLYALEYLKRLHWRYKPHFPLSPSEAASLTSRSYYSSAKKAGDSVSIDFDYGELRAEVRKATSKSECCTFIPAGRLRAVVLVLAPKAMAGLSGFVPILPRVPAGSEAEGFSRGEHRTEAQCCTTRVF